jgi:hypothetical protein
MVGAKKEALVSFRLTIELLGKHTMRGYGECARASEAFALYRRVTKTRQWVVEILDLRDGESRRITGPELEAIAQREGLERHKAALARSGGY